VSCSQCGAPCQGSICRQCEVENAHAHLAEEISSDSVWDSDDEEEGDDE